MGTHAVVLVLSADPEVANAAWRQIRHVTVELGVPVTAGVIATAAGGRRMLEQIDALAAEGGRMIGQSHCRGIHVLLSFETRLPFDVLQVYQFYSKICQ